MTGLTRSDTTDAVSRIVFLLNKRRLVDGEKIVRDSETERERETERKRRLNASLSEAEAGT